MLQTPLESRKEILGYQLIERIGSGGFGEVWSATAPGGLKKALKVVYGYHDGQRAKAELKALDRVKELRHPFLLSLERIEVFDGQLVVVSELADCSLADLFNQYRAKGDPGIPRDEMLRYLRCAAEALDYLSDEHSLQHLDVKPENLLIVGAHIKVADFGLIKDLQQASQSLMSGMTPAYAAPELFDGRPVSNSDQYSLAIVFQEMLTGARPFPGSTPAQLAAQHMHGKPNLSKLLRQDQPIIAKALSKDPALRFKNCRELVEELSNQRRAVKKAIRRQNFSRELIDTESQTINLDAKLDSNHGHDVTAVITDKALPFLANDIKVLDPPECDGQDAAVRPTLIVGVGSTGNKVVQKIKALLTTRYTSMDNVPAIKLLAIDADRSSLGKLRREKGHGSLSNLESLEVPLRKPEGYGSRKSHLSWLSRRWIYNVPRSLQTEGLRPLGRLVFADHFDGICDRIQDVIKEMVTPESLAKTSDTLNMDPGEVAPRVFVIASVSGGIGSGMTLDLAYTIKLLLHERGLPAESVSGVMLHSTYQRYRDPGLSAANAIAFLTEMRHFVENGFPGDASIGMPEFEEQPPFDHTYFNDLGNDLCQSEFESKLDRVAEYILLSSTSRCSTFFDESRRLGSEIEHLALRTFGLSITGPGNMGSGNNAVLRVGRKVLRNWLSSENTEAAAPLVEQAFSENGINLESLNNKIQMIIKGRQEFELESRRKQVLDLIEGGQTDIRAIMRDVADEIFGCPSSQRDSSYVDSEHCLQIDDEIGSDAQDVGEIIAEVILKQLKQEKLELGFAKAVANHACDQVDALTDALDQKTLENKDKGKQLLEIAASLPVWKLNGGNLAKLVSVIDSYFEFRQQEYADRCARLHLRFVFNSVATANSLVKRYIDQLELVSNEFDFVDDIAGVPTDLVKLNMDRLLDESVENDTSKHVAETEKLVYDNLIKDRGGFIDALGESAVWQGQLAFEIRTQAQRVLADAYKKSSIKTVVANHGIEPERLAKWLNQKMLEAKPEINNCGGATRLLVGAPELTEDSDMAEMLQKQFNVNGCQIRGTQGNFVMCFEGEDISLANVAYRLLEARPDAIELVKRLQTRSDVEWVTLDDLL